MTDNLEHGKHSTYTNKGCRCEECKEAAREYRRSKAGLPKKRGRKPKPIEHGTSSGYFNGKCRCDECKTAAMSYLASRRVGLPEGDERHGTSNGYTNFGCRCDECKTAISAYNRPAQRGRALKWRYGVTEEDFEALLKRQGGKCASCGDPEDPEATRRFHVDHDHATGEVRGILCHGCNVALGLLKDDRDRILRLADYLATGF